MLWTLFVVLLLAWLICFVVINTLGPAVHLLLVFAVAVLIYRLFKGSGNGHTV
jgi:hypothetical protein